MSWHPAIVEAAFGADRAADPATIPAEAWIDISENVAQWGTSRGRAYELADIQTGTGSLLLHNDDGQFTPGNNPAEANLLDTARQTGGTSQAGVLPTYMELSPGLTNVSLACAATTDINFQHAFAYQITVLASAAGTPKLFTRAAGDAEAGPFSLAACMRVAASTAYKFSFQHRLQSGTGTSVTANIHWLDSDGAILSTDSTSAFTPTTAVTQSNLGATSHASAKYAALSIEYSGVPGAAHVYHFTALQLIPGSSTILLDPLFWPNIRPGVPVRVTVEDSSLTYQDCFYGFTGEWSADLDNNLVSVDLTDAFELLAEQEFDAVTDDLMKLINPTVYLPLDDPDNTRNGWKAVNGIGAPTVDYPRTIAKTTAAAALSEYVWNQDGPQDGMPSVYFDPESASVGYALKIVLGNSELFPYSDTAPAKKTSVGGWFRMRPREHGGRTHSFFQTVGGTEQVAIHHVYMDSLGRVVAEFQDGFSSVDKPTTYTYADGEWHFVYVEFNNTSGNNWTITVNVDYDGTNGESVSTSGASLAWVPPEDYTVFLGGRVYTNSTGLSMARVYLSSWFYTRRLLTTAEQYALYAVGAPPAIYPGESEDTRIGRLLDIVEWPTAQRDIGTGLSTLVGPHPNGTNALDAIKQTAETAGGVVFINKAGQVVYANRRTRYNPTTALTCDAATLTEPENDIVPTIDSSYVYNRVRVARATGNAIEANNTASQARYGIRTLDLDMSVLSDEEAIQAANWFLHQYAEPVVRVASVTLLASASDDDTLWDYLVGLELFDNAGIDLNTVELAGRLFYVEKIDLFYDQESLTFSGRLDLSPADAYRNICVLDTGTLDDCVLGW